MGGRSWNQSPVDSEGQAFIPNKISKRYLLNTLLLRIYDHFSVTEYNSSKWTLFLFLYIFTPRFCSIWYKCWHIYVVLICISWYRFPDTLWLNFLRHFLKNVYLPRGVFLFSPELKASRYYGITITFAFIAIRDKFALPSMILFYVFFISWFPIISLISCHLLVELCFDFFNLLPVIWENHPVFVSTKFCKRTYLIWYFSNYQGQEETTSFWLYLISVEKVSTFFPSFSHCHIS